MSILIKGMDMPKCCVKCPLLFDETFYCMAVGKSIPTQAIQNSEIAEWCPLVSVQTPHGRLIDADILYEKFAELDAQALEHTCKLGEIELNEEWRKWSAILAERTAFKHDVYDAPTIIEAEE